MRFLLGETDEPKWSRPAMWAVLTLTAFLSCWALSINGYANTYYSAAVLGMSQSWKAFFYGAFDAASFITVDKPPLALWVQALSVRVFGFTTWSLLLPQAFAGVATVAITHHAVRRTFGPVAAIIAAVTLAVTPIAIAVNRGNNPDTLLVLLLTLAIWMASRALASGRLGPLLLCALFIGLAFNTKMLQAYFVVPVIAVVYLVTATVRFRRRLAYLFAAGGVLVMSSFAWLLAVSAVPVADRPYIGSTATNSGWDLVFGYNGLGRIFGQPRVGSPGLGAVVVTTPGGAPPTTMMRGMGGSGDGPGWGRLFSDGVAGQISWLLPLAALGLLAIFIERGRRARTDRPRRDAMLWGGWLVLTVVVFSFAEGIWHTYYTVAMGPPLAACVGIGLAAMVRLYRRTEFAGWLLPIAVAATGAWCCVILGRTPTFVPWLLPVVAVGTAAATITLAIGLLLPLVRRDTYRRAYTIGVLASVVVLLAGPTAYAVTPLSTPIAVTFPAAGPSQSGGGRMMSGDGKPGAGAPPAGAIVMLPAAGAGSSGPRRGGKKAGGGPRAAQATSISPALTDYLKKNHRDETWLVAAVGTLIAAPVILKTGRPVLAIGGFNGNDAAPTTRQLQTYVRDGRLRYVWTPPAPGAETGGTSAGDRVIADTLSWVRSHCAVVDPKAYGGSASATQLRDCQQEPVNK